VCGLYDSGCCLETTLRITVFTFHSRDAHVNGEFFWGGIGGEGCGQIAGDMIPNA